MASVFNTLLTVIGGLLALFLILLALPQSKLRDFLLPIIAWGFSIVCGLLIVSPVDPIPDFIPFLGWIDDAALAVAGIGSAVVALNHKKS